MAALEYYNGSSWVTLSNVSATTITGAVNGTGTGTIATSLNTVQTVSGSGNYQYFNFNSSSSLFQLTNLFSSAGGTTAYNTFTILTDTKDFNFKHILPQAASTKLFDNGTFSLNTHNNTTGVASAIFTASYSSFLLNYITNFNTYVGINVDPHSPLHINVGNNAKRILTLYEVANDLDQFCGFGVSTTDPDVPGNHMRYVTPSGYDHSWQVAQLNQIPSSYEMMRLTAVGNLCVGLDAYNYSPSGAKLVVYSFNSTLPCILAGNNFGDAIIQLESTANAGRKYQLSSNSDGSFSIVDKTANLARLIIDTNGNTTINGSAKIRKLIGNLNAPTVVLGAATGTSPSSTITGTELDGTFSVTTGIGATAGLIGTFTIVAMPSSTFSIMFLPANSTTAAAGLMIWAASTGTTTFTFNTVTTLLANTTYKWNYIIMG